MTNSAINNNAKESVEPMLKFCILWIAANGIGTAIGVIIFFLLAISLGFFGLSLPEQQSNLEIAWEMIVGDFKAAVPFGGLIGIMQWLVLRKQVTNSGFWFLTSAIAMFVGNAANDVAPLFFHLPPLPNLFLLWFLFGCVSGILQWIILQKQVHYSGVWVLINILAGGAAGILLPDLGIIGGSIGWAMTGMFTGGALFMLLQKTKSALNTQNVA